MVSVAEYFLKSKHFPLLSALNLYHIPIRIPNTFAKT
jgi:hypothetical protein